MVNNRNVLGQFGPGEIKPALERFFEKVNTDGPIYKGTPCWEWTASLQNKGYGQFHMGSIKDGSQKTVLAHRFAYLNLVGPIPKGLEPDHLCRNRKCVNPEHLELVTRSINLKRGLLPAPARMRAKTHCPQGHPYSPENTYILPNGWRRCKICSREKARKRYRDVHS